MMCGKESKEACAGSAFWWVAGIALGLSAAALAARRVKQSAGAQQTVSRIVDRCDSIVARLDEMLGSDAAKAA